MTGGDQSFTRSGLEAACLQSWVSFAELGAEHVARVPAAGGIYVVLREGRATVDYLDTNPGGRFNGRDPTVDASDLAANWVEGAEVVYTDNLRRRLREFMRFGQGAPIGHWGGRLIWQLADSTELLVAWRETPDQVPKQVETEMSGEFRRVVGKPPFANEPHRLGR